MKRSVHSIIGLSLGVLVSNGYLTLLPATVFFGWLGGWFPDLDLRFKHRKSLHNFFALGASLLILYVLISSIQDATGQVFTQVATVEGVTRILIAFGGGWFLHLLFDALTPRGIYPLWPLYKGKAAFPIYRSNNSIANTLGILIALAIVLYWINEQYSLVRIARILTGK
ncbi:MAG: metal-dependent hydrolase [Desulfurococcales archaeon]|nr:metal-dependent hydrolase [Desulfurococcales archaeon]